MWRLVKRIGTLAHEFKRRGVFKAVAAYAVLAWGAALAATELLPTFGASNWAVRVFIVCAALGVPVVAVLAWLYEITGRGIVRDPADASGSEDTTLLFSTRVVLVRWNDAQGPHECVFRNSFAIGREEPCELRFDDPHISRRHVEVCWEQGNWWLVDLGSRNGTRLDGKLIRRAMLPQSGIVKLYDAGPELQMEQQGGVAPTLSGWTGTALEPGPESSRSEPQAS